MWLEKLLLRIPKLIQWMYTLLVVMIGWVFFRIEDFSKALQFVIELFSFNKNGKPALYFLNNEFIVVLISGCLFSAFSWKFLTKLNYLNHPIAEFLKNITLLILLHFKADQFKLQSIHLF